MAADVPNMDTDTTLTELRDAVHASEDEFSEYTRSISELKEDDFPEEEAYLEAFHELVGSFPDKMTDLITAYQLYIAALESVCLEQEE